MPVPLIAPLIVPLIVVAAALVAPDGSVCLQRRPLEKAHGGLWEFPGGKVEGGETPEAALIREIAEELGVGLASADLVPAGFASGGGIVILLYACRAWHGTATCLEAEALGWFQPSQIPALAMPPLDYPLADQLGRLLAAGLI